MFLYEASQTKLIDEFANDIDEGFSKPYKTIKPKYLYDEVGSQIFEEICLQEEYYPTKTELCIIKTQSNKIAEYFKNYSLVELGSGSSVKTMFLLQSFLSFKKPIYYFPIDVSHSILYESIKKISNELPDVYVKGVAGDYLEGIRKINEYIIKNNYIPKEKFILFLGSTIGNFEQAEIGKFLKILYEQMMPRDSIMIGFDLVKDVKTLEDAYNDKAGMTSRFNLNLLNRINKELGGHFDISKFKHFSFFNIREQRIEMHLISKVNQSVRIDKLKKSYEFAADEHIHTENSYKYTVDKIQQIASKLGFRVLQNFLDDKGWYNLAILSKD